MSSSWHASSSRRRVRRGRSRSARAAGHEVVVQLDLDQLSTAIAGAHTLIVHLLLWPVDRFSCICSVQGIAVGLAAVADRADTAFVSSTDLPFLHPAFVRAVLGALTSSGRRGVARRARLPAAPHRCLSHLAGADGRRSRGRGAAATRVPVRRVSRPAARRGSPAARTPVSRRSIRSWTRSSTSTRCRSTRRREAGCHRGSRCAAGPRAGPQGIRHASSTPRRWRRPRTGRPLAGPPGTRRGQRPARRRGRRVALSGRQRGLQLGGGALATGRPRRPHQPPRPPVIGWGASHGRRRAAVVTAARRTTHALPAATAARRSERSTAGATAASRAYATAAPKARPARTSQG